jgi:hypothetical protein
MMKGRINEIVSDWGMQTKRDGGQYGPCMIVNCALESGETARVLVWQEGKEIGDALDLVKKGDYWNVVNQKEAAQTAQHDEIVKLLKYIVLQNKAILSHFQGESVREPSLPQKPAVAPSTQPTSPLEQRVRDTFLNRSDTIAPMNPNDEVDLNDIPY